MTAALATPAAAADLGAGAGIVAAAQSQLGKPYAFGTPLDVTNPDPKSFDCSGLFVWAVYQATGRKLIHQSATLYATMKKRPYDQAQPGDAVFFGFPIVHHMGVYAGGGQMIEAADYGIPVRVSAVASNPAQLKPYVGYVASSAPAGVDAEQLANAGIIARVGAQLGASARDIAVAIMTALDESGLRNLTSGDRDSAGLFQQRPSQGWGTWAQVTDPTYSAGAFFKRLLAIPNRDSENPWMEAQDVQHSADPTGSNYQAFWPQAQQIAGATGSARLGVGGSGAQGIVGGSGAQTVFGIPGTPDIGTIVKTVVFKALFIGAGVVLAILGAKNAAEAKPSTNVLVQGG